MIEASSATNMLASEKKINFELPITEMEDVQVVQKTPHLYTDTPHHLLAPLGIEEHVKFPKRANLVGTMVMLVLFSMGFICVLLLKSMSGADKQECVCIFWC